VKAPKISIQIGADTRKLKRDMKQADGIVGKFTTAAKYGLASAAAAAGAFAFKLGKDGVEAAIADEASQVRLQTALKNTTKATEAQIKANEDYITQTQLRYGVEDIALRASLGKLATVTGNLTKAQELQAIALDVSAGAGLSLEAATSLVTKGLQGSFLGFKKLGVVLDENIVKNKDGAAAIEVLGKKYEGAATAAADTTQGKLKRLNQAWDETVEGVGQALLPALEDVADWATSPEGGKALQDFIDGFKATIEFTAKAVDELGQFLDNITPDEGTWLNAAILGQKSGSTEQRRGIDAARTAMNAQVAANTNRFAAPDPRVVNITINGAVDPAATGRIIKKTLNQTNLNAISPNAGDRRR